MCIATYARVSTDDQRQDPLDPLLWFRDFAEERLDGSEGVRGSAECKEGPHGKEARRNLCSVARMSAAGRVILRKWMRR